MALAQAAKYASTNSDPRTTDHLLDLITELGSAALEDPDSAEAPLAVGILDEAVQLIEHVISHIAEGSWTLCPCGEDHGQQALDTKVAETMRGDVDLLRQLRAKAA
ncbi:hypothetical protein [Streptomyces sp. N2A]|uniref:hypothetical protein n=1 Tax=Streptomyces sp. N2A TaxID=3073936 RepID=UPI0028700648|nr:hypothetical protein [Streptomyces sp. N2A]